jgi:hypothetical protein
VSWLPKLIERHRSGLVFDRVSPSTRLCLTQLLPVAGPVAGPVDLHCPVLPIFSVWKAGNDVLKAYTGKQWEEGTDAVYFLERDRPRPGDIQVKGNTAGNIQVNTVHHKINDDYNHRDVTPCKLDDSTILPQAARHRFTIKLDSYDLKTVINIWYMLTASTHIHIIVERRK